MGTYTELAIAGYPILTTKSAVSPEAMTVFRETDKIVRERLVRERNPLVWGEIGSPEGDEIEESIQYVSSTHELGSVWLARSATTKKGELKRLRCMNLG